MRKHAPHTPPGLDGCVLCGKCLEACPLLAATGREELSPRAKAVLTAHGDSRTAEDLARLCLGCGRCVRVCPQGQDAPAVVAGLRAARPDFRQWLWKAALARSGALWPVAATLAKPIPKDFLQKRLGGLLKGLGALSRPGCEPFARVESPSDAWRGRRAALFSGCAGAHAARRWTDKAARILELAGVERAQAHFQCCGATLGSAGLPRERDAARAANVAAWRAAGRPLLAAFCASCLAGLRAYAGSGLFRDAEEEAAWTASITPLSAILQGGGFVLTRNPGRVAWHTPCHADVPDPDPALWLGVPGLDLESPEARCCGFGGVLQLADPALAARVSALRWENLRADLVLTGCSACAMQLAATASEGVRAAHWLDALDL
ncbi:(Fe-S)-binding protein [Desulfovibrio aminophilus]|uniref:(Fe-S)-binding protein n=1 Tax=Desulfovibrio aminophilus TaxID=81425 RepID=UPI000408CEEE|nr:(Fe-S)-binding protein [Desulfovibrio aminophilus]